MMLYDNEKFLDLKTPCYVVDESLLIKNLELLKYVQDKTGAIILLAQKGFYYQLYTSQYAI